MKDLKCNFYDGYFTASAIADKRLKIQVKSQNHNIYYDLKNNGETEKFPLQFGEGDYEITFYQQLIGKSYSPKNKIKKNIKFSNPDVPFLKFNQFVVEDKEIIATAQELCKDCTTDKEKYLKIKNYMKTKFFYNFVKAAMTKQGEMPAIENSWKIKRGTCFDLSAIMTIMFRAVGLPAKLVIGYADKGYHAWNSVKIEDKWYRVDITYLLSAMKKPTSYKIERWY